MSYLLVLSSEGWLAEAIHAWLAGSRWAALPVLRYRGAAPPAAVFAPAGPGVTRLLREYGAAGVPVIVTTPAAEADAERWLRLGAAMVLARPASSSARETDAEYRPESPPPRDRGVLEFPGRH